MKKVFEICYGVVNPNKRNSNSKIVYKKVKCETKIEAHAWFMDHIMARGNNQKRLIDIVELPVKQGEVSE